MGRPVIGSFAVVEKGWRWTQWTLLFLAALCIVIVLFTEETLPRMIQHRHKLQLKSISGKVPQSRPTLREFATIALLRPLRMIFTEPIVGLLSLYVSAEFGTLFSFFAAVPYTFGRTYGFSLEESGLVFLSIVIGCLLGLITVMLCDVFIYRKQTQKYPPHQTPPEHRLYPAIFGSIGLPVGLFWFAWTANENVSWASPAASMISFAWGNLCVFVSTMQYMSDTYPGNIVASAAGANTLARYVFAAAFPLFTIQSTSAPSLE